MPGRDRRIDGGVDDGLVVGCLDGADRAESEDGSGRSCSCSIMRTILAGFDARRQDSAGPVILRVQSRPSARLADAAGLDEPDDALALAAPRSEELQHPVVVDALPGERVADLVREVVVADAHCIGVAEGADPGLGGRSTVRCRAG